MKVTFVLGRQACCTGITFVPENEENQIILYFFQGVILEKVTKPPQMHRMTDLDFSIIRIMEF